jgi:predicted phosphodiesterase
MFILGDIHGNFNYLRYLINTIGNKGPIIQVGDFGMNNNIKNMEALLFGLNKLLGENGNKLYVIRGNHDNPYFWQGNHIYENIQLLPDYTIKTIEGKRVFFVGGAISIDRKVNPYYWVDEVFVYDKDKTFEARDIDIVVTHTAPNYVFPLGINDLVRHYAQDDPNLITELYIEREQMAEMCDMLMFNNNITHHFYGHFHANEITQYKTCEFRCVGINNTYDLRV